jgi:hypothetical protein
LNIFVQGDFQEWFDVIFREHCRRSEWSLACEL